MASLVSLTSRTAKETNSSDILMVRQIALNNLKKSSDAEKCFYADT